MKLILLWALVLLLLNHVVEAKQKDFYTFKVVNSRGKLVSLEKYRGSFLGVRVPTWQTSSSSARAQPTRITSMNDFFFFHLLSG
ncbi:hypothetical protein HF521_006429 [Silurus meridionalis]|uniref:Uncharacterized protein n=1 Tax=Silurus meridionalis TaxID=175797 RepID=A0A8T0AXB0_SILME|nr:hypothetical protein HF521_006429 [Silurus meridionalis]